MTTAQAKKATPKTDLHEMATKCLQRARGDVAKATIALTVMVKADAAAYRRLMDPLVREACYNLIRLECRDQRRIIWEMPQPSAKDEAGRVVHLAGGIASALMNFPLPGGKRLRDATHDEVAAASQFYFDQGKNMTSKGRWLQLIAQNLRGNKTVADVMDEARLASLKAEVES